MDTGAIFLHRASSWRPGGKRFASPFHAHHLLERVQHVHQIGLGGHHGVYILVGHWNFVNHARVLAAFHAFGRPDLVGLREHFFRLGAAWLQLLKLSGCPLPRTM